MNESMQEHASDHCRGEDDREGLAGSQQRDGWAGTHSGQSPTQTEYRRTNDQAPIDDAMGGNVQRCGK